MHQRAVLLALIILLLKQHCADSVPVVLSSRYFGQDALQSLWLANTARVLRHKTYTDNMIEISKLFGISTLNQT